MKAIILILTVAASLSACQPYGGPSAAAAPGVAGAPAHSVAGIQAGEKRGDKYFGR